MTPDSDVVAEVRALARTHIDMFALDVPGPIDVIELARRLGIRLLNVPCWEEPNFPAVEFHSALAEYRVIVVNSLLGRAERNYSIAHEIGHIVQGHRQPRRSCLEWLADYYAREVTMPLKRIIGQLRQHGGDAQFLAGLNGVPLAAMRLRLQDVASELAFSDRESFVHC